MASNPKQGSKRKIRYERVGVPGKTHDELFEKSLEASKRAEERIERSLICEPIGSGICSELNLEAITERLVFSLPPSVEQGRSSRFYRTDGWSYGYYREDGKVPLDKRDVYRVLPHFSGSSEIGYGKCIHFAAVASIEARFRILKAKKGGPRMPKLSVQELINAQRSNVNCDVFHWIWKNGLVVERKCPFMGKVGKFDGLCKGERYYIDDYDMIEPRNSKFGFFIGCMELQNNGPFVLNYKVHSYSEVKSSNLEEVIKYIMEEGKIEQKQFKDVDGKEVTCDLQHSVVAIGHVSFDGKNCFLYRDPADSRLGIILSSMVCLMIFPRVS